MTLPKHSFTNGEPVEGTIMLQNATNLYQDGKFDVPQFQKITVLDDLGRQLQMKSELRPQAASEEGMRKVIQDAIRLDITPVGDVKLTLRPDTIYDLSVPGVYQVYADVSLLVTEHGPARHETCAFRAMFRVLPKGQPAEPPETIYPYVTDTGPNVTIWSASDGVGTNWGATCAGFRMGIRLRKDSFTNGEPVEGTVTLENVTNLYCNAIFDVAAFQEIVVLNDYGQQLQVKPELRAKTPLEEALRKVVMHATFLDIAPGGEAKLSVRLDSLYDLSMPGTYQVYFRLTLPREAHEPVGSKISSAKAKFRLLPQSKSAESGQK